MSQGKSIQVFRKEPIDLEARIIAAIGNVGPRNVAAISRITGAHEETIRYKMKKRFSRLGFRFHADVNYGKLGLALHLGTFDFSAPYYGGASQIFEMLNKVGYLIYYAKILPQGHYVAHFAIPSGTTEEYAAFLNRLQRRGVLSRFTFEQISTNRHPVMDPTFFNFRSGRWEVEWEQLGSGSGSPPLQRTESKSSRLDYYDLLLIKELQKDATQHLVDIARTLKAGDKTLEYHYRTHVVREKLIGSYYVRWTRDIEKMLIHSVATTRLTFRGLDPEKLESVRGPITEVPFLWAEQLLRDGTYIATLQIPLEDLMNALGHINTAVADLGSKVEIGFVKPQEASLFTIPYNLYQDDHWSLDTEQVESNLTKGYLGEAEK